jgi:hypothetical protein
MRINDLTILLNEYHKHFGDKVMQEYFKNIINKKQNKGENNATSKKKSNNSSGRNI